MAEQIIDVDGELIAFPSDMSDAQIEAILKNQTKKSSSFLTGLVEPFTGLEQLAGKAVEAIYPSESIKATNEALRLRQLADEEALAASRSSQGESGIDWARLAGNVTTGLVPGMALERGALAAGVTGPLKRGAIVGAGEGAIMPVTDTDYWKQKVADLYTGAAVGGIGQKVISGASRILKPKVGEAEQQIRDLGVTPTVGQTLGGVVNSTEEFLAVIPFIRDFVKNAREDSFNQFRVGVLNKALKKVDEKLPADLTGYKPIQQAFDTVSKKYDEALKGTSFVFDTAAKKKLAQSLNVRLDAPEQAQNTFRNIVDNNVLSKLNNNPKIDGQTFKKMESDLNTKIFKYSGSPNVADKEIADALRNTLSELKSVFARQNPEQSSKLRKVDAAYRELSIAEDASKRSQTGQFTPENYSAAVKENVAGRKKRAFGRGKAFNQDLSSAAVEVLGGSDKDQLSKIITGAVGTGGGGYGVYATDPLVAAVLGGLTASSYTKSGKKAVDALIRKRPEIVKQVGELIDRQSAGLGGLFSPELIREYELEAGTR
jgi:hypothetical protein